MTKDEARIIRASDVPLTRRPKFWPPEPFQMECPSDWRRGVVVAWSRRRGTATFNCWVRTAP